MLFEVKKGELFGYGRNQNARSGSDILNSGNYAFSDSDPSVAWSQPSEAFSGDVMAVEGSFSAEGALNNYQDEGESIMDKLRPDTSYQAKEFSATDLDGSRIGEADKNIAGAKKDVSDNRSEFKKDWSNAKDEARDMLKAVAAEQGVDPEQAVKDIMGQHKRSDFATVSLATLGVSAGGAGALGGAVVGTKMELSKEEKKLPPEKQKALLDETFKRLQESRKPAMDSRAKGPSKIMPSDDDKLPENSKNAWENLNEKEFKEFMEADPDGNDQEEIKDLDRIENSIKDFERDKDAFVSGYDTHVTDAKVNLAEKNSSVESSDLSGINVDSGTVHYTRQNLYCVGHNLNAEGVEMNSDAARQISLATAPENGGQDVASSDQNLEGRLVESIKLG